MRKMFGKDLTPAKMQMRLPGVMWGSIAMEAGLARRRRVSLRYSQLAKVPNCFGDRMSVLSRYQFCRRQKSWS
jgi:hypothetical protein